MKCHDAVARPPGLNRRSFLHAAGAAVGAALLGGCSSPPPPAPGSDFRGQTLTIFVYSGLDKLFQEHFVEPFEAKTGAKVVLDAGWWDSIGKLKATSKGTPFFTRKRHSLIGAACPSFLGRPCQLRGQRRRSASVP